MYPTSHHKLRVNWTIPMPVIMALACQVVALAYLIGIWKQSIDSTIAILDSRIVVLERTVANESALVERVKGVEVNVEVLKGQSVAIESKIDKLIERGSK
jgi:hypothetical protein